MLLVGWVVSGRGSVVSATSTKQLNLYQKQLNLYQTTQPLPETTQPLPKTTQQMYQYNALVTHNTYFIYLNNLHCCDICYYTKHYFWSKHIAYQFNALVTQNTYFIYFLNKWSMYYVSPMHYTGTFVVSCIWLFIFVIININRDET
jgi:hypothetical protein